MKPGNADPVAIAYKNVVGTSYRYLHRALQDRFAVKYCGTPFGGEAGFDATASFPEILGDQGRSLRYLLCTDNALRGGVAGLECPTALWLIDYWPEDGFRRTFARLVDVVFVAALDYLDHFKAEGCANVYWLPVAAPQATCVERGLERCYDIGFIGNTGSKSYAQRAECLHRLRSKYHLNAETGYADEERLAEVYAQSKIVVNLPHRPDCLNIRVFEALASGALLITLPLRHGIDRLFKDGEHLVVARDFSDLHEKTAYYLANEDARARIAAAGQRLVRTRHTYSERAATVEAAMSRHRDDRCRSRNRDLAAKAEAIYHGSCRRPDALWRMYRSGGMSRRMRYYTLIRHFKTLVNLWRE